MMELAMLSSTTLFHLEKLLSFGRRCKSEPPRRPNSEPGMEAGSGCLPAVDEFSLTA
jgi:hypothetical protein